MVAVGGTVMTTKAPAVLTKLLISAKKAFLRQIHHYCQRVQCNLSGFIESSRNNSIYQVLLNCLAKDPSERALMYQSNLEQTTQRGKTLKMH